MPPKTANKRKAAAAVEVDPSEDGDAANDVQDSQQVADKDMTDKLNATMIAVSQVVELGYRNVHRPFKALM